MSNLKGIYEKIATDQAKKIQSLIEVIRKQDEALKFYANEKKWQNVSSGLLHSTFQTEISLHDWEGNDKNPCHHTGGKLARQSREQTAIELKKLGVVL